MAHRIDWFTDHEMQIANALPNVMPDLATSVFAELIAVSFFLCFYLQETSRPSISKTTLMLLLKWTGFLAKTR